METEKKTVGRWLYEMANRYLSFTLVVDNELLEAFQMLKRGACWGCLLPSDYYIMAALNRLEYNGGKISTRCEKVLIPPYDLYKRAIEYWDCRRNYIISHMYDRIDNIKIPCGSEFDRPRIDEFIEEYRCFKLSIWRGGPRQGGYYIVFDGPAQTPEKMAELIAHGRAYVI